MTERAALNTPWEGFGFKVSNSMTPEQMTRTAKCDWQVGKRATAFLKNGRYHEMPDNFALIRETDNTLLSEVGPVYKPIQNVEVFEFFKKFAKEGKMEMEMAGALWGGRYVWMLARCAKDFKVGKIDDVHPYLLVCSPHVHGAALSAQYAPTRVANWTTLNAPLGAVNGDAGAKAFRMKHTKNFAKHSGLAEIAHSWVVQQNDAFKEAANHLAKTKASPAAVLAYFRKLLNPSGAELKKTPVMMPKLLEALESAPGATMASAKGTWWGALNAVTFVVDHRNGFDRETALMNAWLGDMARLKRSALALALQEAK